MKFRSPLDIKEIIMVMMIAGLILLIASTIYPWWYLSIEHEGEINKKEVETFWLDHAEYDGGSQKENYAYDDDENPYEHPPEVAERTRGVFLAGVGLSVVATILIILKVMGRLTLPIKPNWVILIFLVSISLCLVAPIFFNAAFTKSWEKEYERYQSDPNSIPDPYGDKFDTHEIPLFADKFSDTQEKDLGSESNQTIVTLEWGGGTGYWMAVIGSILQLLAFLLLYKNRFKVFNIPHSPYESSEAVEVVEIVE